MLESESEYFNQQARGIHNNKLRLAHRHSQSSKMSACGQFPLSFTEKRRSLARTLKSVYDETLTLKYCFSTVTKTRASTFDLEVLSVVDVHNRFCWSSFLD